MSARLIAAAIRAGQRRAVDVVDDALDRAQDDPFGCFWSLDAERARTDAAAVDRAVAAGRDPGLLAGVPVAVKDCFDVSGLPTSAGVCWSRPPRIPWADAQAVANLRRAGAIVIGKTAMHQLGWGMSGQAPGFEACRNPSDPTLMPGGSSSGSAAAVGAGIVPIALGTDAGGSVRQPAAWCGTVGFKPTLGSVSTARCAPMAPSLDTVGFLATSVVDCDLALAAATGAPGPGAALPTRPPRVGVMESALLAADLEVAGACRDALSRWESSGAELSVIAIPWERRALGALYAYELADCWADRLAGESEVLSDEVIAGIGVGQTVPAEDHDRVLSLIAELRLRATGAVEGLDVVAGPTAPILPLPLGEPDPTLVAGRYTRVFNGLAWPAASIPCGVEEPGRVGLQLASPAGHDSELLGWAAQLETILSDEAHAPA
ncbi:MAG: amidase [Gaiellales bacterium]